MKPGASTRFCASMRDVARADWRFPTAVIRSPAMPTSPRNHGAPVPSTMRAFAITGSKLDACAAAVGGGDLPPARSPAELEHDVNRNAAAAAAHATRKVDWM